VIRHDDVPEKPRKTRALHGPRVLRGKIAAPAVSHDLAAATTRLDRRSAAGLNGDRPFAGNVENSLLLARLERERERERRLEIGPYRCNAKHARGPALFALTREMKRETNRERAARRSTRVREKYSRLD